MFWEQFWPQLAATLIGLCLGVPITIFATLVGAGIGFYGALRLDRRQENLKRLEDKKDAKERKDKVLSALRAELKITIRDLLEYRTDLKKGTMGESIELILIRDETWQAFKAGGELKSIKDPTIVNKFAEVYFLIKRVNHTSERLFELTRGESPDDVVPMVQLLGLIKGVDKTINKIVELLESF